MCERRPLQIKYPNEKMLELMVEEEEKIRTSQWYEDKCTEVKDIPNGWLDVTEQVQRDVVMRHGFTDQISCDVAVNMLRRASILFPDNEKFKTVPLYVRNNKANAGTLVVGDTIPDIEIHDLDGKSLRLHDLVTSAPGKPNILFASSAT